MESVRPDESERRNPEGKGESEGNESDSEVSDGVEEGEEGERIKAEPEGDNLRKLRDPRLPSEQEVEEHFLRGHCPFRDWCNVCVCVCE